MNFILDDRGMEGQTASLEEQLTNLAHVGCNSSDSPAGMEKSPVTLATIQASWHYVAFVGFLLATSIGVAAWWSSSVDTATMTTSDPAPLTRTAPDADAPTVVALRFELSQQLDPVARDLAALSQTVEQLSARQEQLIRDNDNLTSQLKASREESVRNTSTIDKIKADQIQMAREILALAERLNASQEQLNRAIANASEPKAMPEAPREVSDEEPRVMPDVPLPRPRQSANVAQTQRSARQERPQAKKPQPLSAWPWSVR